MSILSFLFGCTHSNFSRIFGGRQYCLTCGASREYQLGGKPGPWAKERPINTVAA